MSCTTETRKLIVGGVECHRGTCSHGVCLRCAEGGGENAAWKIENQENPIKEIGGPVAIPSSPPPQPTPRDQWPVWAIVMSMFAAPGDAGVGDTVERQIGITGEKFKAMLATFGMFCGCTARKNEWNRLYPYNQPQSPKGV